MTSTLNSRAPTERPPVPEKPDPERDLLLASVARIEAMSRTIDSEIAHVRNLLGQRTAMQTRKKPDRKTGAANG